MKSVSSLQNAFHGASYTPLAYHICFSGKLQGYMNVGIVETTVLELNSGCFDCLHLPAIYQISVYQEIKERHKNNFLILKKTGHMNSAGLGSSKGLL